MRIPVLDRGYVELVETWGSDERIIEAARMSTQKGFEGWGPKEDGSAGDEKLLAYLYNHKHMTPFEMGGLIVEVQAPIFVFREWHRHRTQSYNEMSARYVSLPEEFYVPSDERMAKGAVSKVNKQGSEDGLADYVAGVAQQSIRDASEAAFATYRDLLERGVARELARLVLPVNTYSRMRASANLRNWLAFLTLRAAPNAQWEIQQYAHAVGQMVAERFPRTWELFSTK